MFAYAIPSLPGVGGSSGGGAAKMIVIQVCEEDQPHQCKTLQFVDRFTEQDHFNAKNSKGDCLMMIGEAQAIPCDKKMKSGIPSILQKLHDALGGESSTLNFDETNYN